MSTLHTPTEAPIAAAHAISWGHAVEVLSASRARSAFRLGAIHAFLEPPLRLRQIRFAYNGAGVATGYIAWAYLSDPVLEEIGSGSRRLLDLSEWNEGTSLVVMDLVTNTGGVWSLLREMANAVGGSRCVWWRRADREAPLRSRLLQLQRARR